MAVQRRPMSTQDYALDPNADPNATIAAGEPPPGSFTPGPILDTPAPTPAAPDNRAGIISAYQTSLKRTPTDADIQNWLGNNNYAAEIANSPEAQAVAKGQPYTRTYAPAAGFDVGKLNDPTKENTKYDFGRAAQEYGSYGRGNLQGLVDYYNTKYGASAKVAGDDQIDFGESYGPVDVLNGNGDTLQWLVNDPNAGGGGGKSPDFASLFAGLNQANYSQPGGPGVLDPTAVQQVGQDPFSQLLTNGYADLLKYEGNQLQSGGNLSTAVEAARMPYEIARKSQLANARGELANRGLLGEPGHAQGGEVTAIQNIESGLAPAYTGAINDRLQQMDGQRTQDANTFLNTLQSGTNRQKALADIAVANLEQNRLWNQFVATFGLDRDKVAYDMQHGNTDQYLQLLQLWLESAKTSADGYI